MKLSLADRILVRLLAAANSGAVCEILESRLSSPLSFRPATGRVGFGCEMRALRSLVAAIVRSWFAPGEEASPVGSVYYDIAVAGIDQSSIEHRREFFLDYFADAGEYRRVSQATRMGGVLWSWRTLGILVAAPLIALLGLLPRQSALGVPRVEIVRRCLMVEGYACRTASAKAFIFRQSNTDSLLISAYLVRSSVTGYSIASSTPLWPDNVRLTGDVLVLCNPYQEYEARAFGSGDTFARTVLWGPEDIVDLARYGGGLKERSESEAKPIGVYTQGYWLRLEAGSIDPEIGAVFDELERLMVDTVAQFARANGLELRLLMHPLERRNLTDTENHYRSWNPDYVRMLWLDEEENSTSTFGQFGLGVTTFSTVGFDRLYCGFKTLFYVGDTEAFISKVDGPFGQVLTSDRDAFLAAASVAIQQTHAEFMKERFGRVSWLKS